ncbi:hypothetical protein ACFDR9_002444 [Janthinobacterium sp. CG_23.3]|uniref:hypothetical protein n=1 Tax=unclassified Janthinobacterium TaxID=2610881 RepID=UPI000376F408|nr:MULTISPECIES: hypothetical protein [unclassified Janthinobacterium]MEC5163211.1 hypothetical protein [Janthinobacterium sp. CG_S6]
MNCENLVLEQLRFIRAEIAEVRADTKEIKHRLRSAEMGVASLRRDGGDFAVMHAGQELCYDRILGRVERIEKRLDLVD